MGILSTMVASLSTFYPEAQNPNRDLADVELTITRLLAKIPTLAAMAHKYSKGQPLLYPDNNLDYIDNFLRMMFGLPVEDYKVNPVIADAMNKLLILHADHEQNCSTSAMRNIASSQADPFVSVAGAAAALYGPSHGGANEAVLNMLREIGTKDKVADYVKRCKSGEIRLMGFGHRVYKNYDPRAKIMQKTTHEVLDSLGIKDDPLLEVAMELEHIALTDEYFIEKKLYPNIDFYSGIILRALGIPMNMFTVMFAMSRTVGWISHWMEMHEDPEFRIGRPRQIYTGAATRDYPK